MTDDVDIAHRHADGEHSMHHVDDERIDGLRLREYSCTCGFSAAVLTRVRDEEQGTSWPFRLRAGPMVS